MVLSDGRQARWQRHNDERRRHILDAAIAVIEEADPGEEVHLRQIAERAGLNRSVVYRHFADRADLDRAVQTRIIEQLWEQLLPAMTLEGTVPQIIERIVGGYVGWAVAHPALHRVAEHDASPDHDGPLEQGLEQITRQVVETVALALAVLGAEVDERRRSELELLGDGVVGSVFFAVRRWLTRPEGRPTADRLVELLSESVWLVVDGHARGFGVTIDRDRPLDELAMEVLSGKVGA